MLIEVEITPNPATLRFLLPHPLPLHEPIACDHSGDPRPRIADRLLRLAGVRDLLLAPDFVAVSRDPDADWSVLRADIIIALVEALEGKEQDDLEHWTGSQPTARDEIEQQIIDILRTRVAPAVQKDGGNITLVGYRDGIATVAMRGACGGCPSALMTLKRGVETTLKRYVPELQRVEAVQESRPQKSFWKTMLAARGARFRDG